jgi:16S rRNA processing protein RimM
MKAEFSFPSEQYLLLGTVAKAHGLHGEVKLFLHSGQPENIRGYRELYLVDRKGAIAGPLQLLGQRLHGKAAIVLLATITDRNGAERIEGHGVLLARDQLPALANDEYYWHRLLGKNVVDGTGHPIGIVARLFHNGAQDILVVVAGQREMLIPMTKSIVVDETETTIVVDPPPGLLDLGDEG